MGPMLTMFLNGHHNSTVLDFLNFEFTIFNYFLFFVFDNMGPYGSKTFKTLLLPQIPLEYFETSPDFLVNRPHQGTVLDF